MLVAWRVRRADAFASKLARWHECSSGDGMPIGIASQCQRASGRIRGGERIPPASLRPTFNAGQVSVLIWEKESPPVTLHAAHKALQAWLATQSRKDVIENTLWTS